MVHPLICADLALFYSILGLCKRMLYCKACKQLANPVSVLVTPVLAYVFSAVRLSLCHVLLVRQLSD